MLFHQNRVAAKLFVATSRKGLSDQTKVAMQNGCTLATMFYESATSLIVQCFYFRKLNKWVYIKQIVLVEQSKCLVAIHVLISMPHLTSLDFLSVICSWFVCANIYLKNEQFTLCFQSFCQEQNDRTNW